MVTQRPAVIEPTQIRNLHADCSPETSDHNRFVRSQLNSPFLEFIVDCSQIQQCSSLDGSHAVWRHLLTPESKVHWDLAYVSIVISRTRATVPKFVDGEEEYRKAGQNRTRAVAVG